MAAFGEWVIGTANQLDVYAAKTTVFRIPAVEQWAGATGEGIGLPADQFKYVLAMLAAYPLAILFNFLPFGSVRHAFNLLVGIFLAQFVLGSGWIHSLVSATGVYFILAATMKIKAFDRWRHRLVFVFMMAYMTGSHIYRLYVDYMGWTLDFTGPQMLLTIKLTSMAFELFDGTVAREKLEARIKDPTTKKGKKAVYEGRIHRGLTYLPSLFEFYGYVYCFTSYLAGPAFELREYLRVCNGDKFHRNDGAPPRAFTAIKVALQSLIFMALMQVGTSMFPISNARDPVWLENTAYSGVTGWLYHVACVWIALFLIRCKYYFGWLLAEGSSIISGFGYDEKNKNWRGARNIDWFAFETAQSIRDGSRAWNQCTQSWLENTVYHRTGGSLVATYFVSAFWHGFYPAYYLFFLSIPLATKANRLAHKRVRPLFLTKEGKPTAAKPLYDFISMVCTSLTMNYLATVFQVLSWEYAVTAWKAFFFLGHIIMLFCVIVIPILFAAPKRAGGKGTGDKPKKN